MKNIVLFLFNEDKPELEYKVNFCREFSIGILTPQCRQRFRFRRFLRPANSQTSNFSSLQVLSRQAGI